MKKLVTHVFLFISIVIQAQNRDTTLIRLESDLQKKQTDSLRVEALLNLCAYQKKRDYNKVIVYCKEIHKILDQVNYDTRLQRAKTYGHSGIYKRRKTDYTGALKDYHAAEKIYIKINDTVQLSTIYHNIAFIYRKRKEYQKSIQLFKKAIAINFLNKRYKNLANNYSMMSACYKNSKQIDSAFYILDKAIYYFELSNYEEGKQQAISNKASLYSMQKEYDKALHIYLEYLKYTQQINKKRSIINTLSNIANIYLKTEAYDKALVHINNSIEMAISEDTKQYLYNAYLIRSKIYKAMKKYELAFDDVKKYNSINRKINDIRKIRELKTLEILNTYEKKQLRDSIVKAKERKLLQIQSQNKKLQNRLYSIVLIILLLILLSMVIYAYKYMKKKNGISPKHEKTNLEKYDKSLQEELQQSLQLIIHSLKSNQQVAKEDINVLKKQIHTLNNEYLKRLKTKHQKLTKTDIEICSFIKIGLSRSEIALLRNTSLEAVKSTRFRLKKKLNLTSEHSLNNYLLKL
ncbi:tetratricopeptide repeat protein [Tenacibaculum jejuense]|uniref:Uncharacterized protein n=1 Tax=Tenacibaculum jejuense TaxID=584609 RepID=A0A238U9P5_9FLAO|nr:tetratricopeptide repeat protein [Tenacibaculum jejuense]SNR15288.1 Probable transmembrane protein of unknown function. Tetratricopeptide repeats containing protein [Tenacibaculum jejuense]